VWRDVAARDILDRFLAGITTPSEEVIKVRPDLISTYIKKHNGLGELESWTVVLVGTTDGTPHTLAGHLIGLVKRSPLEKSESGISQKPGLYRIRRVVSPPDEGLDLTGDELDRALSMTQAAWQPDSGRSQRKTPPEGPSGTMIRAVRSPKNGLLLIYPLDTEVAKTADPLIGFAFSFPDSSNAQKVTYRVDNRYLQQEFEGR
jgi:hypothetical protein